MVVLSREETIELIREYHTPPLLNRRKAAEFLSMSLPSFDRFIQRNPHLKLKAEGSSPKYCPKMLSDTFRNG